MGGSFYGFSPAAGTTETRRTRTGLFRYGEMAAFHNNSRAGDGNIAARVGRLLPVAPKYLEFDFADFCSGGNLRTGDWLKAFSALRGISGPTAEERAQLALHEF